MWGYVSDKWELVPGDGSSIWTSYSPEPSETWVCYLSLVFGNLSHQAELRGNRWDPLCLTETQLKYLGNLPWRGSRVLWCKRHTLPRGAAQKLCHSLESLLHFLKRNKKNHQLSPEHYQTQELVSTVSCQTQTAFWCIADADVAGRHRKHVHTRPYNIIWQSPWKWEFQFRPEKGRFPYQGSAIGFLSYTGWGHLQSCVSHPVTFPLCCSYHTCRTQQIKQDSKLGMVATPAISVLEKLKQKNHSKFEAILG